MNKITPVTLRLSLSVLIAIGYCGGVLAEQPAAVEVHDCIRFDTSPPLKGGAARLAPARRREIDRPRLNPNRQKTVFLSAPGLEDTAIQAKPGPTVPVKVKTFEGLGKNFKDTKGHPMQIDVAPPDTNGAVGDSQYVQVVNTSFAVFDKKDLSKPIYGFAPINSIWKGFGGKCETNNDGDPIAQYDKIAKRWVISQFRVQGEGFSQCIAVSTSSDATGTYNRYEFAEPSMNDYPKMGVWPDAYYFTYNMFHGPKGSGPEGARICAYEREKMLTGQKAREIAIQLSDAYFSFLPSDFDGVADTAHLPPAGSPCFLCSLGTVPNSLDIWKFNVNWAHPLASTFGNSNHQPNKTLDVSPFNDADSLNTVPQLGTSQNLDALGDRLMYRLAYRRFADHESLTVSHNISSNAAVAIRWYEIRDPNGDPKVFQQGTFCPDTTCRWMGSLAMDKFGNIALAYSASDKQSHPSIRLAVERGNPDPQQLGILSSEIVAVNSNSSQDGVSRWGDYSSMSVDPTDDSTFYYTTEYLADSTSAAYNWNTKIVVFTVPPP